MNLVEWVAQKNEETHGGDSCLSLLNEKTEYVQEISVKHLMACCVAWMSVELSKYWFVWFCIGVGVVFGRKKSRCPFSRIQI